MVENRCLMWAKNIKIVRCHTKYSNHLNTDNLNNWFIWIPDSMNVRYSNGKVTWLGRPFEYRTFWTINRPYKSGFLTNIWIPDHLTTRLKSTQSTQIYYLNTRLVRYSDGYCINKNMSNKLASRKVEPKFNIRNKIVVQVVFSLTYCKAHWKIFRTSLTHFCVLITKQTMKCSLSEYQVIP